MSRVSRGDDRHLLTGLVESPTLSNARSESRRWISQKCGLKMKSEAPETRRHGNS